MTPYKKRAKAGWSCGKDWKKESNRSERNYAKRELREALDDHTDHPETHSSGLHSLGVRSSFRAFLADFKVRLGL